MMLPKLVRDLVPRLIEEDGRIPQYSIARDVKELIVLLYEKMDEEVEEFMMEPCLEEAGDVYEVLRTLVGLHGMRMDDVIKAADLKAAKCGAFEDGIILEGVMENRPVDIAIKGQEDAYEEEIELHKTYGGD